MPDLAENPAYKALTSWWEDMGVAPQADLQRMLSAARRLVGEAERASAAPSPAPARAGKRRSVQDWTEDARRLAAGATDADALKAAIEAFEGCPLKAGAQNTVVSDGVFGAPVMVIGEGPGAQEDRTGKPFVGRAGHLLDAMLQAIGISRQSNALITNVNFWRPPGNRNPEADELAVCRPFVDRMIELSAPRLIIAAGGVSAKSLTGSANGIMKLHGTAQELTTPGGFRAPLFPIFHPAFLLRRPQEKSRAWRALLNIEARARELGIGPG